MKKLLWFFFLIFGIQSSKAQTLEWFKLFNIHSQNALGGLSRNTIKDSNNNLITAVVESDILKLYQLDSQGNSISTLNTNRECGNFTSIVKNSVNSYALVFDNTPDEINATFKLLFFNTNLEITQEIELNFPDHDFFTFGSFFSKDGILYFTGFTSDSHLIYYLNEANALTLKHISPINNAHRDKVHLLQNNAVMFEYDEGQNHQLRCISTETGQLIWDKYFVNTHFNTFQLNYKTAIGNNQTIYFAGLERTWVSGQAVDVFKLRSINSTNGTTMQESTYTLADTGTPSIDDIKFNPTNNHLYISYLSSYPDQNEVVLEFDANFNLVNQARLAYAYDNLSAWVKSEIVVRDSGNLIFIYTNYKNESENGNLYVVNFTSDLTINGTLELNVEPKNSSESFSNFLMYDNAKLLITGCIPNPNPAIAFEEVQYYLALIDVDRLLNVDNPIVNSSPLITSNPITNTLYINTEIEIRNIIFFDVLGKELSVKPTSENSYDVSHLDHGIYFIKITNNIGKILSSKFIKE
jgi:hypothetical protein